MSDNSRHGQLCKSFHTLMLEEGGGFHPFCRYTESRLGMLPCAGKNHGSEKEVLKAMTMHL